VSRRTYFCGSNMSLASKIAKFLGLAVLWDESAVGKRGHWSRFRCRRFRQSFLSTSQGAIGDAIEDGVAFDLVRVYEGSMTIAGGRDGDAFVIALEA